MDDALQCDNFCMVSGAMHFVRNMVSASVSEIVNMKMAISTCEDNEGVAAGSIDFFNPSFCGAPCPDLSTAVTVGGIDSLNPVSILENIINSVKDYCWEHSPQDVFQRSLLQFLLVPLSEFSESEAFDAMKSYFELSLPEQEELAAAAAASMAYITFINNNGEHHSSITHVVDIALFLFNT